MASRALRALATLGFTALVAASLTGCATGSLVDAGSNPDEIDDGENTEQIMVEAAWIDGGRMIGIVTEGSSTCVPTAGDVTLEKDGVLAVTLEEPSDDTPCTMDYVPRVTPVQLPDGVDPSKDLAIAVTGAGYDGSVDLAGVEGLTVDGPSDMTPSAGWTNVNGTFVVLLWGSSTCPEYITSTEVTADAAVTASLSGIPADKACTADMAPNAVLAYADGLSGVPDVELTLTSTMADDVVIPILGVNDPTVPLG
ncbi:hypothetical protein GCM10009775_09570 [Microbacterium aoyamense]|uniref:Lipoprotein n=1 Tax=Microbacterium aoyamense TaxID=344166 RepID=A0ABP5AQE1_9MICO|nr:hypothetical protein [Microbacterium aoyamense]